MEGIKCSKDSKERSVETSSDLSPDQIRRAWMHFPRAVLWRQGQRPTANAQKQTRQLHQQSEGTEEGGTADHLDKYQGEITGASIPLIISPPRQVIV